MADGWIFVPCMPTWRWAKSGFMLLIVSFLPDGSMHDSNSDTKDNIALHQQYLVVYLPIAIRIDVLMFIVDNVIIMLLFMFSDKTPF